MVEPLTANTCKAPLAARMGGPWKALSQILNGITDVMQLCHFKLSCHTLAALMVALLPQKVLRLSRIVQRDTKPVSQTERDQKLCDLELMYKDKLAHLFKAISIQAYGSLQKALESLLRGFHRSIIR